MKIGKTALKIAFHFVAKMDRKRMRSWPSIDQYEHVLDVDAIGDGNFYHCFDVFYAPKDKRLGKTVFDIHGGAYIYGDRKNNFGFASVLLEKGYDVVLLDYEKNDGKRDCLGQVRTLVRQIQYIKDHEKELNLNLEHAFITGDSAGGHFALFIAEIAANKDLSAQNGLYLHGISFKAIAVCCPVFDFRRAVAGSSMTAGAKRLMFGPRYQDEDYLKLLDVRAHYAELDIPVFVSSCVRDFLKQESFDLASESKRNGKACTFLFIEDDDKLVDHVHNITEFRHPESIRVNDAIDAFFRKADGK